jgi:hypothetical protein
MAGTPIRLRLLGCIVLTCAAVVPPAHGGNVNRDSLIALVTSLTAGAGWVCEGGPTCERMSDAEVAFVRRGDDLFVMSNVKAFTGRYERGDWSSRTVRLERGVIIQRDYAAQYDLSFQFHIEYMAGDDAYPVSLQCKAIPTYDRGEAPVVSCEVTAGTPGANSVYEPQSFLKEELRWRRKGS